MSRIEDIPELLEEEHRALASGDLAALEPRWISQLGTTISLRQPGTGWREPRGRYAVCAPEWSR